MQPRNLPVFLNAKHIQLILKIPYQEAMQLLDLNICPVFIIGGTRRILSKDFNRWLQSKKVTHG